MDAGGRAPKVGAIGDAGAVAEGAGSDRYTSSGLQIKFVPFMDGHYDRYVSSDCAAIREPN